MLRKLVRVLLALLLGAAVVLVAAPAASADTNPEGTLAVDVLEKGVRMAGGGVVVVPLRARCTPELDPFELNVGIYQGTTYGGTPSVDLAFLRCDGQWHKTFVEVSGENGRYRVGFARVMVYLGAYNTARDRDTDATDDVRAWVQPRSAS
jgi:hypothetical protein